MGVRSRFNIAVKLCGIEDRSMFRLSLKMSIPFCRNRLCPSNPSKTAIDPVPSLRFEVVLVSNVLLQLPLPRKIGIRHLGLGNALGFGEGRLSRRTW